MFQQCKRFCVFDFVKEDCGCFHPLYLDVDDTRGDVPPCDLADSTVEACIDDILSQLSTDDRTCPCNQSCYETKFTPLVSSTAWPSYQYTVIF